MAGLVATVQRAYLSLYNWASFLGWLQLFYLAVKALSEGGHSTVYDAVEKTLLLLQTASAMEILHGLVGLVRSPVSATVPQVGARLYVVWAILWSFPETRTSLFVSSLVICWSITEIVRYSFYGMKETLGFSPSWLMWLRYSTFLILYPIGSTSEVALIYIAVPYIKASGKYSIWMPNMWNFSFDFFYVSLVSLLSYLPGSPQMYVYMLGQRKKALSKSKTS